MIEELWVLQELAWNRTSDNGWDWTGWVEIWNHENGIRDAMCKKLHGWVQGWDSCKHWIFDGRDGMYGMEWEPNMEWE